MESYPTVVQLLVGGSAPGLLSIFMHWDASFHGLRRYKLACVFYFLNTRPTNINQVCSPLIHGMKLGRCSSQLTKAAYSRRTAISLHGSLKITKKSILSLMHSEIWRCITPARLVFQNTPYFKLKRIGNKLVQCIGASEFQK